MIPKVVRNDPRGSALKGKELGGSLSVNRGSQKTKTGEKIAKTEKKLEIKELRNAGKTITKNLLTGQKFQKTTGKGN